jgi:cell division protease FtsH
MVTQWGFSSNTLGATAWESPNGSGMNAPQMASEETQEKIDAEVTKLVGAAYAQCKATLETNRPLLDAVVAALLKDETIDNAALMALIAKSGAALPLAAAV